jgi:glyoxylase-like metal-dependent hydrolase (beta-lactamase superfamily II)
MREHTLLLTTSDGTVFLGDLWLRNETSDRWRCECRTIQHTTACSYADAIQRVHGLNRKDKTTTTLGTSHYKCDGTWIPDAFFLRTRTRQLRTLCEESTRDDSPVRREGRSVALTCQKKTSRAHGAHEMDTRRLPSVTAS